jgi:hypothetical protein
MRIPSQMMKLSFVAAAALAIASLPFSAFAACSTSGSPCNSNAASVNLVATLGESLTVSTGATSQLTFSLTDGQTTSAGAVPVTTSWVLLPNRSTVKVYGYFASSTAALTDGAATPDNIPSADVLADGGALGTTFTPFSNTTAGFGGASASLLLDTYSVGTNFVASKLDTINLEVATPATLPAGTYNGTLTFQAQAN